MESRFSSRGSLLTKCKSLRQWTRDLRSRSGKVGSKVKVGPQTIPSTVRRWGKGRDHITVTTQDKSDKSPSTVGTGGGGKSVKN